ncbi:MAG: MMPL family transporter, partial [Planctomycetaceae bacterium]|nr:MMPL family transporter [Planctomycetaceae bacterium]
CESWWPHQRSVMMLSGAVGIALAFLFLRSLRLGLIVVAVSAYTTVLCTAFVPLAGDQMNMVLMVMPTLLNVLVLSGAIHVANYWKHAAVEDPRTAVPRAVMMARQPCVLASITTAIGLFSLISSDLRPVRQFGFYSAIGTLIALFTVLYVLPAMLQLWPVPRPRLKDVNSQFWDNYGKVLTRHCTTVAVASILLCAACCYGLVHFQTETKVIRYFPPNARVVQDCAAIEQQLAGVSSVETVLRFPPHLQSNTSFLERMEIVREVGRVIRENSQISGTISLADFQPRFVKPAEDAGTFDKIKYNRRSSEIERRIKAAEEPGTESFLQVARPIPQFENPGDAGLNQPGEELWRVTAQAGMLGDANFTLLTSELDARIREVLTSHPEVRYVVTGTVPLFMRTQVAILKSLINSFAMAFVIIAFVMIYQLRSVSAGLLSMLPNLMPVGVVFGLVAWCGTRVDVGSMVTASVALGIAVDGTLHLITWFRNGVSEGLTRNEAVIKALSHCGPAMWQTSTAIACGLLMLLPAELLMISRFGWLMASLIVAALVGDLVILPSLLAGPLGSLIERTTKRQDKQAAAASPAPTVVPTSHPHFGLTKRPIRQTTRRI